MRLVAARQVELDDILRRLRAAHRARTEAVQARADRLEQLRHQRSGAERELGEARERINRVELEETEGRLRLETIVEAIRRDLECEPEAVRGFACPPLPPGTSASSRRTELERELRLMGPINPLALEEHAALLERHQFLDEQLEDVRNARRELAKVIRAIDAEIVEVFQAAYADVADNFESLFATLFPGGVGRLRLTEPDHLLETGIEVEARPSGKNVRRLSLLSGGERSLTAMAFLFAVFRSRPSPFYLMDEVEAALDDVNLHRFLDLLHEFRAEAQLLVVSHQKRTMEAADCLYGVTMASAGSSRVVSERITVATPI
jgi:chromosome segregation protein